MHTFLTVSSNVDGISSSVSVFVIQTLEPWARAVFVHYSSATGSIQAICNAFVQTHSYWDNFGMITSRLCIFPYIQIVLITSRIWNLKIKVRHQAIKHSILLFLYDKSIYNAANLLNRTGVVLYTEANLFAGHVQIC